MVLDRDGISHLQGGLLVFQGGGGGINLGTNFEIFKERIKQLEKTTLIFSLGNIIYFYL